jgi:hypothetical protein
MSIGVDIARVEGFDIPWAERVDIPCIGVSKYHWYGGRYTMGSGGQYTMGREFDIPWVRWVNIPCIGGRYTIGRGSIWYW